MDWTWKDKEGKEIKKERKHTSKQYLANFHDIRKQGYHLFAIQDQTTHFLERILMGILFAYSMPFIFIANFSSR